MCIFFGRLIRVAMTRADLCRESSIKRVRYCTLRVTQGKQHRKWTSSKWHHLANYHQDKIKTRVSLSLLFALGLCKLIIDKVNGEIINSAQYKGNGDNDRRTEHFLTKYCIQMLIAVSHWYIDPDLNKRKDKSNDDEEEGSVEMVHSTLNLAYWSLSISKLTSSRVMKK